MIVKHSSNKLFIVSLCLLLLLFGFVVMHKVYAGKPTISLNSPASFPVDI